MLLIVVEVKDFSLVPSEKLKTLKAYNTEEVCSRTALENIYSEAYIMLTMKWRVKENVTPVAINRKGISGKFHIFQNDA